MKILLCLMAMLSLNSFAVEILPTERVNQSLDFADDMNFQNLNLAIERQMKSFARGLSGQIKFGTKTYNRTVLKDSLVLLKQLADESVACSSIQGTNCKEVFNQKVNQLFAIYRPVAKKAEPGFGLVGSTKFTSYYSPDFHGSRTPTDRFRNAIYSLPLAPHQNYTRVDIDFKGALAGKGYEIFFVEESLYDLYLLHVQGGGRILIHNPDGTQETKYLSYAGKNSRSFQMIYKYMLQKGYLKPNQTGITYQRKFLTENPDKQEEIFGSSPSYIYFKESEEEPVGLNNIPLTEGRSLAIDNTVFKTMGIINFVKTQKAVRANEDGTVLKEPFSRFFISQDTGGAIRGNARADLYFGYGPQAELTAYNMNDLGEQYFLIKK